MAPALDLGPVLILRKALEIFRGQLFSGGALLGELLANKQISGHASLKRGVGGKAINLRAKRARSKRGKFVDFTGYWQRHIASD